MTVRESVATSCCEPLMTAAHGGDKRVQWIFAGMTGTRNTLRVMASCPERPKEWFGLASRAIAAMASTELSVVARETAGSAADRAREAARATEGAMSKPEKPYWEMTTDQLAEATREFDREHIGDTFRAMTPAEEKVWRAAIRKRHRARPTPAKHARRLAVAIEAALLKRVDALAKKRGLSRARLVAESLKAMLGKNGA